MSLLVSMGKEYVASSPIGGVAPTGCSNSKAGFLRDTSAVAPPSRRRPFRFKLGLKSLKGQLGPQGWG